MAKETQTQTAAGTARTANTIAKWIECLNIEGNEADFLSEDFDVKQHANRALECGISISEQLNKLSEGILHLNKELHAQVVSHHDDLLAQATGVETLEGILQMMQTRIQSLLSTTDRIKSKVTEPFNRIMIRVTQLTRLQETCDILRRIIRMLSLSKRLRTQMQGGAREITKAAQSLNELGYLCEGVDWTGIEVVEKDRRFISQARAEVEMQAQKMLSSNLQALNQNQVGTALQVFYNLNSLGATVNAQLDSCMSSLLSAMDQSLDVQQLSNTASDGKLTGPGRVQLPANTAAFRANLWTGMEKLMDAIFTSCSQVHHLQKVLIKKRDPVTQVCFINEYAKSNDPDLLQGYWKKVTHSFSERLHSASQGSNIVKQAMEGEFPKLLRMLADLWSRLLQHIQLATTDPTLDMLNLVGDCTPLHQFDAEKDLRQAVQFLETAYLSRSLSRLFDPINLVFPQGTAVLPSGDDLDGIIKTISSELKVASFDPHLSAAVARNVTKTVKLFAAKCEQLLCTDGNASQVIGPATAGQKRNASAINSLYHFKHSLVFLIDSQQRFDKDATTIVFASLEGLADLMRNAVQPLLSSITDAMEAIILTMHEEDFSGNSSGQTEAQCSLYMKELQSFLSRVQTDYLALFECSDFIMECMHPVLCNSIELFVRHASLLRPLGEGGKMRLAADFAQMELAVNPLCKRVGDLGKSYKLLRAFRPLLFQTSDNIAQNHAVGDVIPYSTVLHFLFARAPAELKSPNQVAGWSLTRYTQWLDDHPSENDRLTLIKGALEAYVKTVGARKGTEYAPVYPVMQSLLQKGLS